MVEKDIYLGMFPHNTEVVEGLLGDFGEGRKRNLVLLQSYRLIDAATQSCRPVEVDSVVVT